MIIVVFSDTYCILKFQNVELNSQFCMMNTAHQILKVITAIALRLKSCWQVVHCYCSKDSVKRGRFYNRMKSKLWLMCDFISRYEIVLLLFIILLYNIKLSKADYTSVWSFGLLPHLSCDLFKYPPNLGEGI